MGYRRVEPSFCRGCGVSWSPGQDACISCGEPLEPPSSGGGDRTVLPKAKLALAICIATIGLKWLATEGTHAVWPEQLVWGIALGGAVPSLALITTLLWSPGVVRRVWRGRAPLWVWLAAVPLGVLAGGAAWAVPSETATGLFVLDTGVVWTVQWGTWGSLALVAFIVAEEFFLRGVVFEIVEKLSGRRNAAIATGIGSALLSLSPVGLAVSVVGSVLRANADTVRPCIMARLIAVAIGLQAVGTSPFG